MSTESKELYIWNNQQADSKGPQGLDVGTNAPLATGLVNARTGVLTQLGQVLQEATLGQENKCLHLVLLRFFGWGVKSCIIIKAHYISKSKYIQGPWRAHIASLEASLEKVVEAGARVVVVSFGSHKVKSRSNFA